MKEPKKKIFRLYLCDESTEEEITDEIYMTNAMKRISLILSRDEEGEHVDNIIQLLIDYAALFPHDQSWSINEFEKKIKEASFWLDHHFAGED